MLEQLLIFTHGGLILWCNQISNVLKGSPIDALTRSCLLEELSADATFSYDAPGALYMLKWAFDNELGLVFVAFYQRFLNLTFIDDLLSNVRREFAEIYDPKRTAYPGFGETFGRLQREAEAPAAELKKSKQVGKPALPAASAKKNGAARSGLGNGKKKGGGGNGKNSSNGSGSDDTDGDRGRSLQNGTNGHANGVKDSACC